MQATQGCSKWLRHVKTIRVVAGLIERRGQVLLDRRRKGTHLEGTWEFPGGKCEPGETDQQALRRELREELGVDTEIDPEPVASVHHAYAELTVDLILYAATITDGEPEAIDVDEIAWFDRKSLRDLNMPAADEPLVDAVLARAAAG